MACYKSGTHGIHVAAYLSKWYLPTYAAQLKREFVYSRYHAKPYRSSGDPRTQTEFYTCVRRNPT